MKLKIRTNDFKYNVIIEEGITKNIEKYITIKKGIIITDTNIPKELITNIKKDNDNVYVYTIVAGEKSKSLNVYSNIIEFMLSKNLTRFDSVIAVGGGVVGDLAGLVAGTYKRGCPFINIPTSTLAMVDSSIGGKVACDYNCYKNVIGLFKQPDIVLIDVNTLKTLPIRDYYNGLIESLKTGIIGDKVLYSYFLNNKYNDNIQEVIRRSLIVKKKIVQKDPYEKNLRKLLNLGHTIGHAIEGNLSFSLLHGEAVALGMLYMIEDNIIRNDVTNIINKMNILTKININEDEIYQLILNDKKVNNDRITIVIVNKIGKCLLKEIDFEELKNYLRRK